jgi:hypothetical protein
VSGSGPKHECAAHGCDRQIPIELLMCWPHWRRVPRDLQREIWRTVKLFDRTEYDAHVHRAVAAVRAKATADAKKEFSSAGGDR